MADQVQTEEQVEQTFQLNPESASEETTSSQPSDETPEDVGAVQEETPQGTDPPKKPSVPRSQRRIEQLAREKNDLQAQLAEERALREAAERKLEAGNRPVLPLEHEFEDEDEYRKAMQTYLDNDAEWKEANKEPAPATNREAPPQAGQQQGQVQWNDQQLAFREEQDAFVQEKPDYWATLDAVAVYFTSDMQQVIVDSGNPAVAYSLAKDPQELMRISELPLAERVQAMSERVKKANPERRTESGAPDPIVPVGANGAPPVDVKNMDFDQYSAHMNRKEREKRGLSVYN